MFSQDCRNGFVYVDEEPSWVLSGVKDKDAMRYVNQLTRFYVLNNPNKGLSAKRIPLDEYGWTAPWRSPQYLNKKLKKASSSEALYWSAATYGNMEQAIADAGILSVELRQELIKERIAFYDCKKNQTLSVLYHIRNSICHGRFTVRKVGRDLWFVMEDVAKAKKKGQDNSSECRLSARMLIRFSTLLKWQDIICKGPDQ